jgi:hypothetical protein
MYLALGKVKSGFLPGATFSELGRLPNTNPEKCFTDTGVTKLVSDVAVIDIQYGHDKIACWGKFIFHFQPGINNN